MHAPPPGFLSFNPNAPTTIYRRNLPHLRQNGATYFVTFRLRDSIPLNVAKRLQSLAKSFESQATESTEKKWFQLYQDALDQGIGHCLLQRANLRKEIVRSLHCFAETSDPKPKTPLHYQLVSYVVMPNHVHALIQPLQPDTLPLEKILQSMKAATARRINRLENTTGPIWTQESHDRIIRDATHLNRAIQYIGRNPAKAGLGPAQTKRWVDPRWEAAGWGFRGSRERVE